MISSKTYQDIVWDYNISKSDFVSILHGKKQIATFDQIWAISRVLENTNYYQAVKLVPLTTIKHHWDKIKPKLFNKTIRNGYEYILHHPALSSTR